MEQEQLNAALAARPAPRVTKEEIDAHIARVDYHVLPGNALSPGERVTICQITLDTGFDVRGESACVDPANFDPEIGRHYAHEDAYRKLWPLFGFLLSIRLRDAKFERMDAEIRPQFDHERPAPGDTALPPHIQRVVAERDELAEREAKLRAFFATPTFAGLDPAEQEDMRDQADVMAKYGAVLGRRLIRAGVLA